jgi:hypothetical protein
MCKSEKVENHFWWKLKRVRRSLWLFSGLGRGMDGVGRTALTLAFSAGWSLCAAAGSARLSTARAGQAGEEEVSSTTCFGFENENTRG